PAVTMGGVTAAHEVVSARRIPNQVHHCMCRTGRINGNENLAAAVGGAGCIDTLNDTALNRKSQPLALEREFLYGQKRVEIRVGANTESESGGRLAHIGSYFCKTAAPERVLASRQVQDVRIPCRFLIAEPVPRQPVGYFDRKTLCEVVVPRQLRMQVRDDVLLTRKYSDFPP